MMKKHRTPRAMLSGEDAVPDIEGITLFGGLLAVNVVFSSF